jgi:hypothetical protein
MILLYCLTVFTAALPTIGDLNVHAVANGIAKVLPDAAASAQRSMSSPNFKETFPQGATSKITREMEALHLSPPAKQNMVGLSPASILKTRARIAGQEGIPQSPTLSELKAVSFSDSPGKFDYPDWAGTVTEKKLFRKKLREGLDVSLPEVIEDIKLSAITLDLKKTSKSSFWKKASKPVQQAAGFLAAAKKERISIQTKYFGRELSPDEHRSLTLAVQAETNANLPVQKAIATSKRVQLQETFAGRKLTDTESSMLAISIEKEIIAEKVLQLTVGMDNPSARRVKGIKSI